MRKYQTQKPYQLTAVDVEILKLITTFHFLSVDLIMALRGIHSRPKLQTRLKLLYEAGFLDRRALPSAHVGAKEYIYALSTKSIRVLQDLGYSGFSRFRPDEFRDYAFPFLDHCMALNKLLVCAYTLERSVPSISLVSLFHDLDLHRAPVRITVDRRLPGGGRTDESVTVIPDAILDFRMRVEGQELRRRRVISLELDNRGTTSVNPFKNKLRAYYWFAISEAYKERFAPACIVAYATTAGQSRLNQMIEWTEQELQEQQLEHESGLYHFTSLPAGEYDPREIFCSPIWRRPFDSSPTSLLWQV